MMRVRMGGEPWRAGASVGIPYRPWEGTLIILEML